MPSIENKVLKAAMQRPPMVFNDFCKLVLTEATCLLNKTDGRLRFLDYSGDRVVPGAIKGKMQEHTDIFARKKNQGLVGIAISSKKTEICNNVQKSDWFKDFIKEIRGKAQGKDDTPDSLRCLLEDYDKNVLQFIQSEIVAPILIGEEVIGVLSVLSDQEDAFHDDDKEKLEHFASIVEAGLLNRRLIVQEELSAIERDMVAAYQVKDVLSIIARGIKETLADAIPNIFLYNHNPENPNESPFEFLTTAGESKEKKLGNSPPRNIKGVGLGMQAIDAIEEHKQKDVFFVEERVQDNKGSPTAKEQGIYTTGCVPLVIGSSVVGLLYVHFKDKIHFFTDEEKKALNLFAKSAAIAIKNATSFETYSEQFGDVLLKEIEDLAKKTLEQKDSTNWKVLNNLNEFSKLIRITRGDKEISQTILKEVADLCKILELPDDFAKTFEKFQKNEGILYSLPYYRDHFAHMFQVFLLGYVIINRWWQCPNSFLEAQTNNDKLVTLQTWFLTAIQHDIAYYIEKADSWVPTLAENTLGIKSMAPSGQYNWGSILTKPNNMKYIEQLSKNFTKHFCHGQTDPQLLFEREVSFKKWYMNQLLEYHDHGALSGLALLHFQKQTTTENIVQDAALAVVLHNYCKKKDEDPPMGQLIFANYPLACLLAYCDAAQEWGRAKTDKNELRLIDPNVQFKSLTVTPSRVEVILSYNLADICKKSGQEIEVERSNIRQALINGAESLNAWTGVGDKKDDVYAFYIRAEQQKDTDNKIIINNGNIWAFSVTCRTLKEKPDKVLNDPVY